MVCYHSNRKVVETAFCSLFLSIYGVCVCLNLTMHPRLASSLTPPGSWMLELQAYGTFPSIKVCFPGF